ncbi:hypothetical protein FLA105534_01510 [Flavobacterium bizetiae]|uniref:Uncharacterized protein n=1 Tax=Flavobacterium bizetiae TaxID=2704140 RepID=A0A6J4GGQ5_9FLAO|nr:hypothetical protein FLA105534_01510 [Flavobacterium bizetiae]CAD5342880.1 hypothetical protein FLA105535_02877 [Flavobacterium bizetiae]CAD5349293.1 hypothetical protein FLA105534_03277 [Flavobacterium bizetiae]
MSTGAPLKELTVTVGVSVICIGHEFDVKVAKTLKVVVADRFPVGNCRTPPLPSIDAPIRLLEASLN